MISFVALVWVTLDLSPRTRLAESLDFFCVDAVELKCVLQHCAPRVTEPAVESQPFSLWSIRV